MPPNLKKEVEEAVALLGMSFTTFAIQTLVERAREVKSQHSLTVLCDEARDSFVDVMTAPPEPTEALRRTLNTRKVTV